MGKAKRAAIYARMSKEDGDKDDSLGIKRQLIDCRRKAASEGWSVEGEFTDVASGYDVEAERPRFDELKQAVKSGTVDVVIVYALDRISRRVKVTAEFADLLDTHGVDLVSEREGPAAGVYLHILAALAQSESQVMSLRLRAKFKADFEHEDIPKKGGQLPFGYRQVRDEEGELVSPYYEPDQEQADLVRELARRVIQIRSGDPSSESGTALVKDLKRRGEKTSRGKHWTWQTIRHKLESPTIAGYMRHHDYIRRAPWEALITEDEWQQLNKLFDRRIVKIDEGVSRIERVLKPSGRDFGRVGVLTGLLYTEDGNRMVASTSGQEPNQYELYISNAPGDHTSIRRDLLEKYVFGMIAEEMVLAEAPPPGRPDLETQERTIADIDSELAEVRQLLESHLGRRTGRDKPSKTLDSVIDDLLEDEHRLEQEAELAGGALLRPVRAEVMGNEVEVLSLIPWLESLELPVRGLG